MRSVVVRVYSSLSHLFSTLVLRGSPETNLLPSCEPKVKKTREKCTEKTTSISGSKCVVLYDLHVLLVCVCVRMKQARC